MSSKSANTIRAFLSLVCVMIFSVGHDVSHLGGSPGARPSIQLNLVVGISHDPSILEFAQF